MTRMQQLSTRLLQTDDFSELLGEILDAAIEITGANMGTIQLMEGDAPRIVSQRGFEPSLLSLFEGCPENENVCRNPLERFERVIVEDIAHSSVFAATKDAQYHAGRRRASSAVYPSCQPVRPASRHVFNALPRAGPSN